MFQRESRRLRELAPEFEIFNENCFICLSPLDVNTLTTSKVTKLSCCAKWVHTVCQSQWETVGSYCAHCKRNFIVENDAIWNPPEELTDPPQREVAREALNSYQQGDRAFRNRVTPEVSNHAFEKITRTEVCTEVVFVIFQFPFSVDPIDWFGLWEAIDAYLSFHSPDLPMIISANVFSAEELHIVHKFRLETIVDRMIPMEIYLYTSRVRTRFRYLVNRQMEDVISLTNIRCDDE